MTTSEPQNVVMLRIPQPSVAVVEATIIEWYCSDGSTVEAGQPLYRLETEKVEMDVEAPVSGVLFAAGEPGETYPVGEEIGYIEIQTQRGMPTDDSS